MKFFTASIVSLFFLPSVVSQCADDSTFKFIIDIGNEQDCAWLTKKNAATRISNYCGRGHVKGACQASCNFCPCEDNGAFTFTLDNGNTQDCAWFGLKNTATRQGNYCYENDDAAAGVSSSIGNECVEACGFCRPGATKSPTKAPVKAPTKAPVKAPTKAPTKAPVKAPTKAPVVDDGSPSASPTRPPSPQPSPFPTLKPTSVPSDSPSERPSVDPSVSPSKIPSDSPSSKPSRIPSDSPSEKPSVDPSVSPSKIPSDSPSDSPSMIPSDKPSKRPSDEPSLEPSGLPSDRPTKNPSSEPSVSPTGNPTQSVKPSPRPSASPSRSPSFVATKAPVKAPTKAPVKAPTNAPVKPPTKAPTKAPTKCSDSSTFRFLLDVATNDQDCGWLTRNKDPEKNEARQDLYCPRGLVKGACLATCNSCSCVDTPGYTFPRPDNNVVKSCAWISEKSIRRRFCYEDYEAGVPTLPLIVNSTITSDVGDNCIAACGFCSP